METPDPIRGIHNKRQRSSLIRGSFAGLYRLPLPPAQRSVTCNVLKPLEKWKLGLFLHLGDFDMQLMKKELNGLLANFRKRILRSVAVALLERGVSPKIVVEVTSCSSSWVYQQWNGIKRSADAEEEIE